MEGKKLNLEKPLLSARHLKSAASPENGGKWKIVGSVRSVRQPPAYKSELKSGPVSNPGTVPFEWEQIPGRPKDGEARFESHVAESHEVPKLPPGRTLRVGERDFDRDSVNPVVRKDQTGSVSYDSLNIRSSDGNVKQSGRSGDGKEELENCSSGYDDEEFLDALETLSRADSLLTNCSLSGFSGLESPRMKVSGTSLIDSQTRDFMMGRFLPAAKAVASETPQHTPRKPPVVDQQFRQLRKMVEDKRPQLRYGPDFALEYSQHYGNRDEESDAEYDEGETFQRKICGLLPSRGMRRSFCLLNPLPGMSTRSTAPTPPPRKSQTRPSSFTYNEADRKQYLLDSAKHISSVSFETSKHQANREALENNDIPTHHLSPDIADLPTFRELLAEENKSENLSIATPVAEKTLYVDTEHNVRSHSNSQTEPEVKRHEILTEKTSQMMSEEGFTKMHPKGPRNPESKIYSEFPAPPPLIKAPSDSWLGRTLPSISAKNTSVHSYRGTWMTPKDQAPKPKSSDPKWETMVRMTKMQDKHLCFSEDRLTPIPEA